MMKGRKEKEKEKKPKTKRCDVRARSECGLKASGGKSGAIETSFR